MLRLELHGVPEKDRESLMGFYKLLDDFFTLGDYEHFDNTLRDLAISACGRDNTSGTHSLLDITGTIDSSFQILRFVRNVKTILTSTPIDNYPDLQVLLHLSDQLNYEVLEDEINRALQNWVLDDSGPEHVACLEYISQVTNLFSEASVIMKICEEELENKTTIVFKDAS